MITSIKSWLKDPFGRKELKERHEPLLKEMEEIKGEISATLAMLESRGGDHPMGRVAGNRRIRRRYVHE